VCLITLTDSPENKVIKEVREGQRSMCIFVCIGSPDIANQRLTSEDRLVHTQSCGADRGDSDISRDFVTNYTGKSYELRKRICEEHCNTRLNLILTKYRKALELHLVLGVKVSRQFSLNISNYCIINISICMYFQSFSRISI